MCAASAVNVLAPGEIKKRIEDSLKPDIPKLSSIPAPPPPAPLPPEQDPLKIRRNSDVTDASREARLGTQNLRIPLSGRNLPSSGSRGSGGPRVSSLNIPTR